MEIVKKIALSLLTAACATAAIAGVVWIIVGISSCSSKTNVARGTYPFVTVMKGSEDMLYWEIMADKETRVMYFYNKHGITVMLEADGSPKLWTGDLPE